MKDRQPYPGKEGLMKHTPCDASGVPTGAPAYYAKVDMADSPLEIGTPFSKANILSDTTAAKYFASVTGVETVDQVLSKLGAAALLSGGSVVDVLGNPTEIITAEKLMSVLPSGAGLQTTLTRSNSTPFTQYGATTSESSGSITYAFDLSSLSDNKRIFMLGGFSEAVSASGTLDTPLDCTIYININGTEFSVASASLTGELLGAVPNINIVQLYGRSLRNTDTVKMRFYAVRTSGTGWRYADAIATNPTWYYMEVA